MSGTSTVRGTLRTAALVLFGAAWLLLLLVVLIGAGYGSRDPLLAVYLGVLVLGPVIVWRGASHHQTAAHAAMSAFAIVATLWLGTTYG